MSTPLFPKVVLALTFEHADDATPVSFSEDIVECEVVSTPGDTKSVTTLDGTTHSNIGPTTYALRIVIVQDWSDTRPGLARWLWEHQGDQADFVYNAHVGPWGADLPGFSGTINIVPGPYGGAGNEYAGGEILLPIDGTPSLLDAAPA